MTPDLSLVDLPLHWANLLGLETILTIERQELIDFFTNDDWDETFKYMK